LHDPATQDRVPDRNSDDALTLTTPARLKRVGREMRMLVETSDDQTAADRSLLRIIARAHDIPGTPQPKHPIDRPRHCGRGGSDGGLHLYPLTPSLAGAGHHQGHCQRSPTATAQRHDLDAARIAAAGRLGRAAQTARIVLSQNRRCSESPRGISCASQSASINRRPKSQARRRAGSPPAWPGYLNGGNHATMTGKSR